MGLMKYSSNLIDYVFNGEQKTWNNLYIYMREYKMVEYGKQGYWKALGNCQGFEWQS